MKTSSPWALKEWAVICAALNQGRQSLLLRKGGIDEGPEGFVVRHQEFWLFPTRFHQSAGDLVDDAADLLNDVRRSHPPQGKVRLALYATVEQVMRVDDESDLDLLQPLQILSPQTVHSRFHYRDAGLFVLLLRVFRASPPHEIDDAPEFSGCHSWIDLGTSLPTVDLEPVLTDEDFARHQALLSEIGARRQSPD